MYVRNRHVNVFSHSGSLLLQVPYLKGVGTSTTELNDMEYLTPLSLELGYTLIGTKLLDPSGSKCFPLGVDNIFGRIQKPGKQLPVCHICLLAQIGGKICKAPRL